MNPLLRCCIATATLVLLAGCAHQGTMRHQPALAAPGATHQPDGAYIHAVEAKARVRGVDVHWVNPPVKRMVAAADDAHSD